MPAAEPEPHRRWSARAVLVRPAAVLAAAVLLVYTAAAAGEDPAWIPVFGVPAAALLALAWRPHARRAGVAALVLALVLGVLGGVLVLAGGLVLWVPAIVLAIGALTRRAAWRPRRVAVAVASGVAALAALTGVIALVEHAQAPDQIVVHPEPGADLERISSRYVHDPRVAAVGWTGESGPMEVSLQDGVEEREQEALRRELVADPDIRSARRD